MKKETEDETALIKKLALIAMVSDDTLMDRLVLKGGNAVALVYKAAARASKDLDFSMDSDFSEDELKGLEGRIAGLLKKTFASSGYEAFDVRLTQRPKIVEGQLIPPGGS